jgi:hypothetical protein
MMFIKDWHPLALEIEGILDDKAEVSTIAGHFKILDKIDEANVSAIVGVISVMSKVKFKINFSGKKCICLHARCLVQQP